MKNIIASILFIWTSFAFAQAPEKMSYQAVIRDGANALVINSVVGTKVSILQGSVNGTVVYAETHTELTNANGLLTLQIGNGATQSGNFSLIDWTAGPYFIQTETDPTGGSNYSITGTSEMMSTPYALYAKTSGSSIPGPEGPVGPAGPAGPTGPPGLTNGGSAGVTPFWDGSAWITNSANIYNEGGNVGIGTASPTAKLEVNGDALIGGIQMKRTNSTQSGQTLTIGSNGALIMVNFYTQCQSTSVGGLIYVSNTGIVQVISSGGTTSGSLTASGNVLSISNLCGVTFSYTFNVANGVATLVPGGGFYTEESWLVFRG